MADEQSKKPQQEPQAQLEEQLEVTPGPVPIEITAQKRAQAQTFFDRAVQIATGGNPDYAVQMYLEGLLRDPDNLQAHQALLEQALRRQAAGGKKAGIVATLKLKLFAKTSKLPSTGQLGSRNPVAELLQAEEIWAKDPQNLNVAGVVVQKMMAAGCLESAKWLAIWLGEFNARAERPDGHRFSMLADVFAQLGLEDKAIDAYRAAANVFPNDAPLHAKLKNMLASQAMRKGKYDDQGGFRQSLHDRDAQESIQDKESITRKVNVADKLIARARQELQENPDESGKVIPLVDALLNKDDAESDQLAIGVLQDAHQKFGSYRFKQRAGEIHMRSNRRLARALRVRLKADPENTQLMQEYKRMIKEHVEAELDHFRDSAKNYPTDMRLRFEVGRRFLQLGRYDEAIPALQEGQRDPKNHMQALSLLGQCFFKKKWYSDAIDVYTRALETPDVDAGGIGKELRYYLGRAYQAAGQADQAKKAYSLVAQADFLYKDVRQRLDHLRNHDESDAG